MAFTFPPLIAGGLPPYHCLKAETASVSVYAKQLMREIQGMDREHLGSLAAFAVIAEERNFTRAAARLSISASALSHAMRGLEERLHVRLLSRSTRSVSTTQAGERLLSKLRPALSDIDAALQDLEGHRERPAGRVRVATSRLPATMFIAPALPGFAIDYPDVAVELIIDEGLTDIVAQRFDAGIRLGESLGKDMISVRISPDQLPAVVAAPGYLEKHGIPKTPHDLREHRCIGYWMNTAGIVYKWEYLRPFLETYTKVTVPQLSLLLLGLGVAGFAGTYGATALLRRHLYALLRWLPLALAAVTLALLAVGHLLWAVAVTMIAWGALQSAIPVSWSTWLSKGISDEPESGGGLIVAAIQLSIMLGAALGGLLLDQLSIAAPLIGGAALLALASLTVGNGSRIKRQGSYRT